MNRNLLFSVDEFARRVAALQAHLRQERVGVVILDELEAMFWIAGYAVSENRWRCCCVPAEGAPFFLLRRLDTAPLEERSWIEDVVSFVDWEDPVEKLAAELSRRGFARVRIGLDFHSYCMPLDRFAALRRALQGTEFVDVGNIVWELRLKKSQAEIAYLRRAASIADEATRRASEAVRLGGTERDVAAEAARAFMEFGADPGAVGPITSGTGWGFLHGHLHDHPLERGAIVHKEIVPRVNGYSARIMRPTVVGAPNEEQARVADLLIDAQDRQIAAMVPGARAAEVDAILRRAVLEAGLRPSYDNITGYTLGYYHPAGPRTSDFTRCFHPQSDWVIESSMVFHMYVAARGLAFSETVLVGERGPERLTRLERRLFARF
jgi:Xaa-Pro dipeptidase